MSKTEALLSKLVERINAAPDRKPSLYAVPSKRSPHFDAVARESHIRMIRSLAKAYRHFGVQIIIDQATLGHACIEDLGDDALIALHRDLDRARECIRDDVSFEEAGLIRHSFD
ncbi:hypothetical protein [Stenotrophomonas lactitubi]|uniref:hypothetical protein n=1 Tax=Stenotrophomonas lactitubi TaxID=2045214 RepID=UPI003875FB8D